MLEKAQNRKFCDKIDIDIKNFSLMLKHRPKTEINKKKVFISKFYKTVGYYFEFLIDIFLLILFKLFSRRCDSKKPKILFTAQDVEWRYVDKNRKSDQFFEPILKILKKEYTFIGTYPIERNSFLNGMKVYFEKLMKWDVSHKPFNLYWSIKIWKREIEFLNIVKKKYEKLSWEEEYQFFVIYPHIVKYIEMAKSMIEKEKPNLILLQNEYGIWEKCLIFVAKKYGIPTVAIQHGVIHPSHMGYFFKGWKKDEIDNILADKLCVYGNYEKSVLIKNGYPEDRIIVTGHHRYDILSDSEKIFNKKKIFEKYKLPKNKKIVVWVTQTHGLSENENLLNAETIFKTFDKLKNKYHLVIKLHPNEDQNAPLYTKFNEKYKQMATIVKGSENTFELLYLCDAIITKHSTVGIEAIIMNKPIILTELFKSANLSLYTNYGFDLVVRKEYDLERFLELIESNKYKEKFKKLRKKFMMERVAHFGRATKNIAEIIRECSLK